MPLSVVRNDITKVRADAIVNTANPKPLIGGGTDTAIYKAAGEDELLKARQAIGRIDPGEARATSAYKLHARYLIHTVGPIWKGGVYGEAAVLRSCYDNSLELAQELGCESIAFPLIATGAYGFPKDKAIEIATKSINSFLKNNDMKVILVIFDKESFKISATKFKMITAYIDTNYVDIATQDEYSRDRGQDRARRNIRSSEKMRERTHHGLQEADSIRYAAAPALTADTDIDDLIGQRTKTFRERIKDIMDERGLSGPDVYGNQILISKKVYSDFNTKKDYHPNKFTAIAFCLALKLPLGDTLDILNSAGWTLSTSRKEDLVVRWHIERSDYEISHINDTLETLGLKPLQDYKQ